ALTTPMTSRATAPPADAAHDEAPAERAKRLRKEGKALLDGGKTADALPLLEEAERIDPGMLSEFRLPQCYQKLATTGSAYVFFPKVAGAAHAELPYEADEAKAATLREREEAARQRATALEPLLARLKLNVPLSMRNVAGFQISLDDVPLSPPVWEAGV